MTGDDNLPIPGTGPRLITIAEAAQILRVSEQAVRDWIADELISYEVLPSGEHRLRLSKEAHERSLAHSSSLYVLDLQSGVGGAKAAMFEAALAARRREHQLGGLRWTDVDVDALTEILAARLSEVLPDPDVVHAERGMIWVAGAGIDVAQSAADGARTIEERLISVAERTLETVSEALSEITSDPWPAKPGEFPGGFPPVAAGISDGWLLMSYGEPDAPILELAPIALADVVGC